MSGLAGSGRREQGQALVLALFVLLLLGISLALLALSMRIRLEETQREIRRVRLDLLLDGVVDETLAHLAHDPTFSGVAERSDGTAGEAQSAVERQGTALARIEATARLGPGSASVSVLVQLVPGPPRVVRWRRGPLHGPP